MWLWTCQNMDKFSLNLGKFKTMRIYLRIRTPVVFLLIYERSMNLPPKHDQDANIDKMSWQLPIQQGPLLYSSIMSSEKISKIMMPFRLSSRYLVEAGFRLDSRGIVNIKGKGKMKTYFLMAAPPDGEVGSRVASRTSQIKNTFTVSSGFCLIL